MPVPHTRNGPPPPQTLSSSPLSVSGEKEGGGGVGRGAPFSFASSFACVPTITTYNTNSLSFYASSGSLLARQSLVHSALEFFLKETDILCLQETNLARLEQFALGRFSGCAVSLNNLEMHRAGTAIIDSPSLRRFYKGTDVLLPPITKGHVQLRHYTPLVPGRPPFQLFNFYLKSGVEWSFNTALIKSLLTAPSISHTFVCGDFNFVEKSTDTTSANPSLPTAAFLAVWEDFKTHFSVGDVESDSHTYFHVDKADPSSPFSHTSRLDRFLAPTSLFSHPLFSPVVFTPYHNTNLTVTPRPGPRTVFSDHLPLRLSFCGEARRSKGPPNIPKWVAEAPSFEAALRSLWVPRPSLCPFRALLRFKRVLFKAAAATREERILQASIPLLLSQQTYRPSLRHQAS